MQKSLIFFSILIVSFIAFLDAKYRINELDEVAANTPSQVEMKQMINKPDVQEKYNTDTAKNNLNSTNQGNIQKRSQDNKLLQDKQDSVNKRRETITNPIN